MKLLIHKYSATIEQCYIDVANRDKSTLPLDDPQTPPPSHHPTLSFIPSTVSEVQLSPVDFQVEEWPQLLFGGRSTLEEKEGGATQQYFERNGDMTTLPLLVAPVVTVPGFGDGSIKPTPAPNWSQLIQQLEAWCFSHFPSQWETNWKLMEPLLPLPQSGLIGEEPGGLHLLPIG